MGVYSAPSQRRWAYDVDGTSVYTISGSTITAVGSPAAINSELATGSISLATGDRLLFIAPSTGSVKHVYYLPAINVWGTGTCTYETSPDSTDGINGTWATINGTPWSALTTMGTSAPDAAHRTGSVQANSYHSYPHAVRILAASAMTIKAVHLYGNMADDQLLSGAQAVVFETNSVANNYIGPTLVNAGDLQRNNTASIYDPVAPTDGPRYLRNIHNTKTANSIVLSFDSLTAAAGALAEHQVRYNGGTWGSTATITSIGPTASSALIEIRRNIASNALIGPYVYRLKATVGSWT